MSVCIPLLLTLLSASHGTTGDKAKVMILGVYHFDSPNLDFVKSGKVDHLSEEKQEEIAEVLDRLAAFAPTKVVLEATPEDKQVEERYEAFRKDACKLSGDEREQLGFQLAKQFGHPRVYLADHKSNMDLDSVLEAARESGDQRFLGWFDGAMGDVRAQLERQAKASVREALVMLNEPANQDRTRDFYLQLARVGAAKEYVGAEVLAAWYRRNFCIFANLASIADSPETARRRPGRVHAPTHGLCGLAGPPPPEGYLGERERARVAPARGVVVAVERGSAWRGGARFSRLVAPRRTPCMLRSPRRDCCSLSLFSGLVHALVHRRPPARAQQFQKCAER
jgi:hypothetical protein